MESKIRGVVADSESFGNRKEHAMKSRVMRLLVAGWSTVLPFLPIVIGLIVVPLGRREFDF